MLALVVAGMGGGADNGAAFLLLACECVDGWVGWVWWCVWVCGVWVCGWGVGVAVKVGSGRQYLRAFGRARLSAHVNVMATGGDRWGRGGAVVGGGTGVGVGKEVDGLFISVSSR